MLFLWAFFCPFSLYADVIYLKNGRTLEGIIIEETEGKITLDLGFGTIIVKREGVKRIERATGQEEQSLQDKWKKEYFDSERFTPPRLKGLVSELNILSSKRDEAVRAESEIYQMERQNRKSTERIAQKKKELVEKNALLAQASPEENVQHYNELVTSINKLSAELVLLHDELIENRRKREETLRSVSGYFQSLSEFSDRMKRKRAELEKKGLSQEEDLFFLRVEERMREYRDEFHQNAISCENVSGRHVIVTAFINKQIKGSFLVDTGATVVTLSEKMALDLHLDLDGIEPVFVTLADGKNVPAKPVLLKSVQVGEARAENVQAVVLGQHLDGQIDGLLGMSFLRHFLVQISSKEGKLFLYSFDPEKRASD